MNKYNDLLTRIANTHNIVKGAEESVNDYKVRIAYIQQNCDEKLCSRLINEHSVVRLLYQMRNKIVHELSSLGAENKHGA